MIKGLYTAGAGMMLQMARQDVVANNLANVNTGGYKKDETICQAFPEMLISRLGDTKKNALGQDIILPPVPIGSLSTGAIVKDIVTDHSSGNIKYTENNTDLAISNEGYFVIRTPEGERFTRNGAFKINDVGVLVNDQGYPVIDNNNNPIELQGEFSVDKAGNILVDNQVITKLKIAVFADKRFLQKQGDSNMNPRGQTYTEPQNPGVLQGYQEISNVNAVQEMVKLISVMRAYESCQKVVQAEDETMGVAIDQVGAVN
ncbi:MAG: flagellar basal-body rod protein FlgF [Firmicutes bacterium HGW-Firmicutes-15]|nr:MAG: flagellar basal-body rod protein FlgF [Firmicutes bacterium HGW-Firmicutes-15]